MKIVHCFYTMGMGGAQVLAVDLLNKMCLQHQTALVIVNDIRSQALLDRLDKKVAVYSINRREGSRNPWPLVRLNLLLRKLKPDIIHLHEPDIGRILKFGTGKKLYTIHDTGIPAVHYHHYDALVAISDAVRQDVVRRYHRPVRTVYNGIDTSAFGRRTLYRIEDQTIRLIQLSRLMHEKKGQDVLVEAVRLLREKLGPAKVALDFVGDGPSAPYLKALVQQLGLSEEVTFLGEQNREWLYGNLARYHLLVQPSRYEGFGLTILEGFAAGLPVLASDIEGPAEIIRRAPGGYLFQCGNASDCADALLRIVQLYQNGAMERLMGEAVPVTEKEYALDSCVDGYLQEYQTLLKG